MATSRDYEEIPADELEPEEGTGTGSAFCEDDYDHEFWDDKIKFALKEHCDAKEAYLFYLFQIPTTQDAIRDILKPRYSGCGGTIIFPNDIRGFGTYNIANMEIKADIVNGTNHQQKR